MKGFFSNRWSVLTLLFAVRSGLGIQYQIIAALSPYFMHDFSLGIADIGLLIGLYHAPGALLAFPGGAIAARLGDKRVVLAGVALMIVGEAIMALSPLWGLQIGGRLLAGAGGILLNVVMTKMLLDWFAGRETATAMAIFGNAALFGMGLALVTLPSLAGAGGRLWASGAVGAYLVVAFLAMAFLYRAPIQSTRAVAGQSVWPDQRALAAVLTSGVIYGLYNVALVTIFGFGPLMLTERGWSIEAASSTTSIVLWLAALSLPAGGVIADRTGRGSAILLGGLLGFAVALAIAARAQAVLPAFILVGVLSGLPCGPIMSLPGEVLTPQTRAIGMGALFTVYYSLQIIGPWVIGRLAESAGGSAFALDMGALLLCVSGAGWFVFRRLAADIAVRRQAEALG